MFWSWDSPVFIRYSSSTVISAPLLIGCSLQTEGLNSEMSQESKKLSEMERAEDRN